MTTYPRLPDMDDQQPGEPAALYGARIVRWLLGDGCVATLADWQVELAEYAAAVASTTRGYLGVTYARLSELRHELAAATARRKAQQASGVLTGANGDDRPAEGPMAPLTHPPDDYPPVGDAIDWPGVEAARGEQLSPAIGVTRDRYGRDNIRF